MIRNFKDYITNEENKEDYIDNHFQELVDKTLNNKNFDKIINDIKYVKNKINILDKLETYLNIINKKYIQMNTIEDGKRMYSELRQIEYELQNYADKVREELVYKLDDIKNNTLDIKVDISEMGAFLKSI